MSISKNYHYGRQLALYLIDKTVMQNFPNIIIVLKNISILYFNAYINEHSVYCCNGMTIMEVRNIEMLF